MTTPNTPVSIPHPLPTEALKQHRDRIHELLAKLGVIGVRVLLDDAPIRKPGLYDVEFVGEVVMPIDVMTILRTEHELEQLLQCRVHIHDLLVDCEDNRVARKESMPL